MPPDITPITDEDGLRAGVAVWNEVFPDDPIDAFEVQQLLDLFPRSPHLLATVDDRPVGNAYGVAEPGAVSRNAAEAAVVVLREHRSHGIGSALFRAVSEWAAGEGFGALEGVVLDADPDGLASTQRHGFRELSREARVALDLTAVEPPRVEPPAGITITTWAERPDLSRGLYAVSVEASADIPGADDPAPPYDEWLTTHMGGPGDRPEATFVALAADEVVGYAKLHLAAARPDVAHHDLTGVRRAWRGRGIARALKATQIAWAKDAGYRLLITANEVRNAPIRHLNEEFGYGPFPGRARVHGPLAPPATRPSA